MRVAILEGLEEIRLLRGLISIGSLLDMGLLIFFGRLLAAIAMNPRMLSPRYGRAHRLAGTAFLGYMIVGTLDARPASFPDFFQNIGWLYKERSNPFSIFIIGTKYRLRVFPTTHVQHVTAGAIWVMNLSLIHI